MQLEMATCQCPNIYSERRRWAEGWGEKKKRRKKTMETVEGKKNPRETWFKLPQFCISHQENGIRFHPSDLIWYSSCRNCIRYQDKWEITEKHLEREIEVNFGMTAEALCLLPLSIQRQQGSLWWSPDTWPSGDWIRREAGKTGCDGPSPLF